MAEATLYALARAAVVASAALLGARATWSLLAGPRGVARSVAWAALLMPFLTPPLLVGYAYGATALSLVRFPAANEGLYAALLTARLLPVSAIVLTLGAPRVSAAAVHAHRLLGPGRRGRTAIALRGPLGTAAVAWGAAFLLAFTDRDLASLLGIGTWSVRLFDAHAGGLTLPAALWLAAPAAAVAGVVALGLLLLLLETQRLPGLAPASPPQRGIPRRLGAAVILAALAGGTLIPAGVVVAGAARGAGALARGFVIGGDVLASLLFAAGATAIAYPLARPPRTAIGRRVARAVALPGLLGPLLIGLATVAVFSRPAFAAVYDTPLPLLLALGVLLLPYAMLLRLVTETGGPVPGEHLAALGATGAGDRGIRQHRALRWALRGRQRFWAIALLFCWAYYDVTVSHMLAPSGMTPVTALLYNQSHYGRSYVLSALFATSLTVPVALLAGAVGTRRLLYEAPVPSALWTLEDVGLGGTDRPRLSGVSATLGPGATAVIGASGAGKTSLLNLLVGFERPDRGRVVAQIERGARSLPLYWVPQDGGLWPHLDVDAHLAAVQPTDDPGARAAVLRMLALDHRRTALPDALSRGERARLSLARALSADAAVLVLDEPLAHVDPPRREQCWAALRRWRTDSGCAMLFATHDPARVLGEADFVLCLDGGRVAYSGEARALYWRPATRALAAHLGEANWFGDDRWGDVPVDVCVRPELVQIERTEDATAALCVVAARFTGAVSATTVRHDPSGEALTVFHRPAGEPPAPGARVRLSARAAPE